MKCKCFQYNWNKMYVTYFRQDEVSDRGREPRHYGRGVQPRTVQTAAYFPYLSAVSSLRGNCSSVWERSAVHVHCTHSVAYWGLDIWSHSEPAYWNLFITVREKISVDYIYPLICAANKNLTLKSSEDWIFLNKTFTFSESTSEFISSFRHTSLSLSIPASP